MHPTELMMHSSCQPKWSTSIWKEESQKITGPTWHCAKDGRREKNDMG